MAWADVNTDLLKNQRLRVCEIENMHDCTPPPRENMLVRGVFVLHAVDARGLAVFDSLVRVIIGVLALDGHFALARLHMCGDCCADARCANAASF